MPRQEEIVELDNTLEEPPHKMEGVEVCSEAL